MMGSSSQSEQIKIPQAITIPTGSSLPNSTMKSYGSSSRDKSVQNPLNSSGNTTPNNTTIPNYANTLPFQARTNTHKFISIVSQPTSNQNSTEPSPTASFTGKRLNAIQNQQSLKDSNLEKSSIESLNSSSLFRRLFRCCFPIKSRTNIDKKQRKLKKVAQSKLSKESNADNVPESPNPETRTPIFNVPLSQSLSHAKVNICTTNQDGQLVVWGQVPAVVAKCGANLKDYALETEGVFRVPGSSKRMKELQAIFEKPPRFGKNLDWATNGKCYTVHDVASLLRRFLTQMPEPVIPISLYDQFRGVLQQYSSKNQTQQAAEEYKRLITTLPAPNHYLLLYLLDLLAVFAKHADKNKMTASNLGVIFQPGIISRPDKMVLLRTNAGGEEAAEVLQEQKEAQAVLEFLVAHQDLFLLTAVPQPTSIIMSKTPKTPSSVHSRQVSASKEIQVGKAEFLPSDSEDDHQFG